MALIKCKECGKEVSDKAESCPNCGFNVKKEAKSSSKSKRYLIYAVIIFIIYFVGKSQLEEHRENFKNNEEYAYKTIERYFNQNEYSIVISESEKFAKYHNNSKHLELINEYKKQSKKKLEEIAKAKVEEEKKEEEKRAKALYEIQSDPQYIAKAYLDKYLKDPDSLEIIEWSNKYEYKDKKVISVRFRAKNSFGGYAIEEKTFITKGTSLIEVKKGWFTKHFNFS